MNILLIGSGGRESAIAHSLSKSLVKVKLYIAPGNPFTAQLGSNVTVNINDFRHIASFITDKKIDMIVVGPEEPLINGITDFIQQQPQLSRVMVVGPVAAGAKLEGSKAFSKQFMHRHAIPTAGYASFTKETINEAKQFFRKLKAPYVIKASGPAAGKGVLIIDNLLEADAELDEILNNDKFGKSGNEVVIEEFLQGIEVSVFVATDGKNYIVLPEAKDYKRIGDGDTGLNTGGMGAVSPVPFCNEDFMNKVRTRIIEPTINGLRKENIDYKGFIFIGLMNVADDPYVIEYNCRMGDPETEAVFPRITSDTVLMMEAIATGKLDQYKLEVSPLTATTVIVASGGYPGNYEKGKVIIGLNEIEESFVYHAGTNRNENGETITAGGRVLAVTSLGKSITDAKEKCYRSINKICFDNIYYRKDIGKDLL